MHYELGEIVPATVVDHIKPHRGDPELFWDASNHQALCKHCHDSHKQRFEKSGTILGSTPDGTPLNPKHHWHQSEIPKG
jgi:5-methylcytosine-specific restriction endonuclease McrA